MKDRILQYGDRLQGTVNGELVNLRVLRPMGSFALIVDMAPNFALIIDMASKGGCVGALKVSSMLVSDIAWYERNKQFRKIENLKIV